MGQKRGKKIIKLASENSLYPLPPHKESREAFKMRHELNAFAERLKLNQEFWMFI